MMKHFRIPGVLLIGVLLSCCSSSLYIPTASHVSGDATLEELTTGREVYVRHCSSCHNLYEPKQFAVSRWKEVLPTMQHKAKITVEEIELISKYLLAGSR